MANNNLTSITEEVNQEYGSNGFKTKITNDSVEFDSIKNRFVFKDKVEMPELSVDGKDVSPYASFVQKTASSNEQLESGVYYNFGTLTMGVFFTFKSVPEGKVGHYMGQFTQPESSTKAVVFPPSVKFSSEPEYTAGKTYQFSVVNGLCIVVEF